MREVEAIRSLSGGDLAPSLGGKEIFFHEPRFLNDDFSEKIPIFTAKISDDLFLVVDQVFLNFAFLFPDFPYLCYVKCRIIYDPFLTRNTPFSTLFILLRASDNTASPSIGGDGCMERLPISNFAVAIKVFIAFRS